MPPALNVPFMLQCLRQEARSWQSLSRLRSTRQRVTHTRHLQISRRTATAASFSKHDSLVTQIDNQATKGKDLAQKLTGVSPRASHDPQEDPATDGTQSSSRLCNDASKSERGREAGNIQESARLLMRRLPSSVVILSVSIRPHFPTTASADNEHNHANSLGVAISSFSTVTLGPRCMVSFNIRKPSRTLNAVQDVRLFRISVLEGNKAGRAIASAFLQFQHAAAYQHLQVVRQEAIANRKVTPEHDTRAPEFSSAIASLSCELKQCIDVEDHVIVVAQVLAVNGLPLAERQSSRLGLVYFDGEFGRAQLLDPSEDSEAPASAQPVVDTQSISN